MQRPMFDTGNARHWTWCLRVLCDVNPIQAGMRARMVLLLLLSGICLLSQTVHAAGTRTFEKMGAQSNDALMNQAVEALSEDELETAAQALSLVAARRPRDAAVQTLLALTYHRSGEKNAGNLDMAQAGYDIALNVQPGNFWAAAFAGRIAYERGEYDLAASRFAEAVLARPDHGMAMLALASAAYMNGSIGLAALAADRAVVLNRGTRDEPMALRLAAFAHAASAEADVAGERIEQLRSHGAQFAEETGARVARIIQTSAVDDGAGGVPQETSAEAGAAPEQNLVPDQIMVDVAIVLSQRTRRERIGLNLLDGLNLNYGYGRNYAQTRDKLQGLNPVTTAQRVITRAITIPELNYNLNMFNRSGQFYSLVARPSLTAYRMEPSEFFVGSTLKVAIGGVNFSSLEQIDIGIELKVTPLEITAEKTRVKVEASRSFLTEDGAGQFQESLSTFRQRVAATAEVTFGETLILSGLSESVDDNTYSETPLVGDVPLLGSVFNQRSKNSRRDAALMLITPTLPGRLATSSAGRNRSLQALSDLWSKVIDPGSNQLDTVQRLSKMRMFTRAQATDTPLNWPNPRVQDREAIRDLFLPGMD